MILKVVCFFRKTRHFFGLKRDSDKFGGILLNFLRKGLNFVLQRV